MLIDKILADLEHVRKFDLIQKPGPCTFPHQVLGMVPPELRLLYSLSVACESGAQEHRERAKLLIHEPQRRTQALNHAQCCHEYWRLVRGLFFQSLHQCFNREHRLGYKELDVHGWEVVRRLPK